MPVLLLLLLLRLLADQRVNTYCLSNAAEPSSLRADCSCKALPTQAVQGNVVVKLLPLQGEVVGLTSFVQGERC